MENTPRTNLIFENVKCPVCGGNSFDEFPEPKTIFQCSNMTTGKRCSGIVCKCNNCDRIYPSVNFGKHGDVYECKTCGKVQWEYTDYMKTMDMISSWHSGLSGFRF